MRDISLHILDLVQNSIKANANLITLKFEIDDENLFLKIEDDGYGIDSEFIKDIKNPFTTTRTTRKVGMGISLITQNAELTGGYVDIESKVNVGTWLTVCFKKNSIDCLPLGDIVGTICTLIIANPMKPDFLILVKNKEERADFDTREIRRILGDVPLNETSVISWIEDTLNEELMPLFGGII